MMCNDEAETTASEFQRQDYKQTMKGVKTRDETRPKKRERGRQGREDGDRLAQLSAHKAAEG